MCVCLSVLAINKKACQRAMIQALGPLIWLNVLHTSVLQETCQLPRNFSNRWPPVPNVSLLYKHTSKLLSTPGTWSWLCKECPIQIVVQVIFNIQNGLITTPNFAHFEHYPPKIVFFKQKNFSSKQYHRHTNKQLCIHHQTSNNLCVPKHYNHPSNKFL